MPRRSAASPGESSAQNDTIEGRSQENINAANECVRFILCREGSKIPIKRAEISKHLSTVCQLPATSVNSALTEANKILKQIYGYKLVQVEGKGGIQYIVSLTQESDPIPCSYLEPKQRVLLNATLTHIFMSGGSVKDDDMWRFLEKCGLISAEDQSNKKILTNLFTRQLYLCYNKVGEGDFVKYVFEWGQRATEETSKLFILQKLAQATGKEPDYWFEQHQEALKEESEIQVVNQPS